MRHAAYGLLTALTAQGVAASPAETHRDFVWMTEAAHSTTEPCAATF